MPFYNRPDAGIRTPVPDILLSTDAGDEPRYLTMDMQYYVLHLIQTAHFPREAVPREAMISAAVDYYICTVENGGHDAFVGNSGWDPFLREAVREGLATLGLDELAALFAELEAFAADDPARFEASDWQDPTISALDDRFHALPINDYFDRHAQWIRRLPGCRMLPRAEYLAAIEELTKRNRPG